MAERSQRLSSLQVNQTVNKDALLFTNPKSAKQLFAYLRMHRRAQLQRKGGVLVQSVPFAAEQWLMTLNGYDG